MRLLLGICFRAMRSGLRFGNAGAVNVDAVELSEYGRRSMFAREPWWMMLVMGVLHARICWTRRLAAIVAPEYHVEVGRFGRAK